MEYRLEQALPILERTPKVLIVLLEGLHEDWVLQNEGPETFSPFDVVGHLLHGEHTDWMQRLKIILSDQEHREFVPFDRFAQYRDSQGKSLSTLLQEFSKARNANLEVLRNIQLSPADYERTALHPSLGRVTLRQLLSTWVAHDLNHIAQIARVMGKQYKEEVGPWREFLRIMQ